MSSPTNTVKTPAKAAPAKAAAAKVDAPPAPPELTAEQVAAQKAADEQKLLAEKKSKAYSKALATLRETNAAQFQQLLKAEYSLAGLEYKPRLSQSEKALKLVEEALAAHPELAAQVQSMIQPEIPNVGPTPTAQPVE